MAADRQGARVGAPAAGSARGRAPVAGRGRRGGRPATAGGSAWRGTERAGDLLRHGLGRGDHGLGRAPGGSPPATAGRRRRAGRRAPARASRTGTAPAPPSASAAARRSACRVPRPARRRCPGAPGAWPRRSAPASRPARGRACRCPRRPRPCRTSAAMASAVSVSRSSRRSPGSVTAADRLAAPDVRDHGAGGVQRGGVVPVVDDDRARRPPGRRCPGRGWPPPA